ncbi:hypothetical protein Pcinc_043586 [Petrolisthes cinctipes]|uniref:Uncharacterized protein n=1 Tax=Petrolisthes cinctipes TaxID=88211 RepID=A0AAE1BHE6_PETCI|nr:hypothetical protein Pcinc_043586 [Petrolisthes cinctipes]
MPLLPPLSLPSSVRVAAGVDIWFLCFARLVLRVIRRVAVVHLHTAPAEDGDKEGRGAGDHLVYCKKLSWKGKGKALRTPLRVSESRKARRWSQESQPVRKSILVDEKVKGPLEMLEILQPGGEPAPGH